jgi:hypothetical protein
MIPTKPFEPPYPHMPQLNKYRKIARANMMPWDVDTYSKKLVTAIRALQRSKLQRKLPTIRPRCASRTWHNNADGSIGKAVRRQQAAELQAYVARMRRKRTDAKWRDMYKEAMRQKNGG